MVWEPWAWPKPEHPRAEADHYFTSSSYDAQVDTPPIDLVLFDLGGVLIEFGGVEPMKALSGIETDDELWERWLTSPWVRLFERGHCSPDDFATGMVAEWQLDMSPSQYLGAFTNWPGGVLDGALELVTEVRDLVPTGCLSNTNTIHWNTHFAQWALMSGFDHRFLSFEIGAVKPDKELFQFVASAIDASPERTLFLDDNILNIDAALSVRLPGPAE